MNHGMIRFIATLFLACLSLMAQGVEEVIYYHNDALGSPIIATDQEGRVVWRKSYAPYGQPIGQTASNEPGYTGKFEEPDLGIQNFGARWYDPRIGRFLAIDPAGFDPQNPQSFNRYAYANNNPYKYVDPDGWWAETAIDVMSLGLSANAFGSDPSLANGLGLTYDAVATAVPLLPAGFGILKNAGNAADALGDASGARTAAQGAVSESRALDPQRLTQDGETFVRYESGNPDFSRVTPSGGVTAGTYAAPASDGLVPLAERARVYNLPNPEIPRANVTVLQPPAGTPIIGPKPVMGGTGDEVIFPDGF
jgi:RHS repeat-associated protein